MSSDEYPKTVLEVLDDRVTFNPKAMKAVRRFAASRPCSNVLMEPAAVTVITFLLVIASCWLANCPSSHTYMSSLMLVGWMNVERAGGQSISSERFSQGNTPDSNHKATC